MAVRRGGAALGAMLAVMAIAVGPVPSRAQETPPLPETAPPPLKPDDAPATEEATDTWIFSGSLQSSHEGFSGTLVTSKSQVAFELKLDGGATCDGENIVPGIGLVRLPDITCTDARTMRALFVPQGGEALRVFGHVGDERFVTTAHLLGDKPIPEKGQTAQPKAPPAHPLPDVPPAPVAPPARHGPSSPDDPG